MYVVIKKNTCWISEEFKTQHLNIIPLCLNSLYNCVIAGGLSHTSPLKLMSYLSLIHRHRSSPQPQSRSVNTWPLWWRTTRLADCVKTSERLAQRKFNDYRVSWGSARRKDDGLFLHGLMQGRGKTDRGRREWAGERKHKRLLSVTRPPFNSPQGRHTFPPLHIQAVLNSDSIAYFMHKTIFRLISGQCFCLKVNLHSIGRIQEALGLMSATRKRGRIQPKPM